MDRKLFLPLLISLTPSISLRIFLSSFLRSSSWKTSSSRKINKFPINGKTLLRISTQVNSLFLSSLLQSVRVLLRKQFVSVFALLSKLSLLLELGEKVQGTSGRDNREVQHHLMFYKDTSSPENVFSEFSITHQIFISTIKFFPSMYIRRQILLTNL